MDATQKQDSATPFALAQYWPLNLQSPTVHRLLLLLVGLLAFGLNLGATRLWDVDEAIFSQAAIEMSQRGDWITPYYNGQLFAHKPPLMYWFQIIAFQLLGKTELAARLFSALFSLGTLILVYEIGRVLFNNRVGLWAGLSLAGCINFVVVSRAATPDSYLTFFCSLALFLLIRETSPSSLSPGKIPSTAWEPRIPARWRTYALSYVVMSLGVLVKGPVAIVLPMAVWGMFLLVQDARRQGMARSVLSAFPAQVSHPSPAEMSLLTHLMRSVTYLLSLFGPIRFLRTVWQMRPLTAISVLAVVAGPWYAAVAWQTNGQFLEEFLLVHHFGRATTSMEHHQGSIFYYPVVTCIGTFPWCVLIWPALVHLTQTIRSGHPARTAVVLLLCWIGVWMGCFSLVATKLANYIIPAYPAVALLFGVLLDHWLQQTDVVLAKRYLNRGWITLGGCGIAGLIGVPIATRILFDGELSPALVGLIPILGAYVGWSQTQRGQIRSAITTLALTATVFCTAVLGYAALPIDSHKNTHLFAKIVQFRSGNHAHLATYKYSPPSLVFYSGLHFERLRSCNAVAEHFQRHPADAFLVTTESQLSKLKSYLPSDYHVYCQERLFLKSENLVVVGHSQPGLARTPASATSFRTIASW